MKHSGIVTSDRRRFCLRGMETVIALGIAALVALLPAASQAQQWEFEPIVSVGGEFDDNATLSTRTDLETEISGLLVNLEADISYSSPATTFVLRPRFLSRNYNVDSDVAVDEDEFDSDDFFLTSQFRHRGQKTTFAVRAAYDQQKVRTAERAISDIDQDPGDITDDDTGLTVPSGTRDKLRLAPSVAYQLSQRSSIGATFDYIDVKYDDVIGGILADYADTRLSLDYRRQFSNVNTALLKVTARNFDSDRALEEISGYGIMAGFERKLSEKTTLSAMIGFEDTEQTGADYDPEVVGEVTLTRRLQTISMFAQYRRTISATGFGDVESRNAVNVNFERRLSQKVSAGLGIRAYDSTQIGGATTTGDRSYVQLQSTLRWYFSRSFVLEADYRYSVNDRGVDLGGLANSNQVNVWFVYQPRTVPEI